VLTLALDTSSPAGSLAVLRDERLIGTVSTWTDEIYSSRIFRHVDFLLRELSIALADFDLFAVAAGPGSFTGVRVGLAAVKGWAEVYRKPIAAVSALEAVAVQSHSHVAKVVPVLDARREQVYFAVYQRVGELSDARGLALDGEECVMNPEEFLLSLDARSNSAEFTIVTPAPELIAGRASRNETAGLGEILGRVEKASAVLAPHIGLIGYERAQRGELVDSLTLEANYVRRTDAELHWKAPKES
jgi:tRNA threonylcarbamoyladenosine biosynthesis protein TsaB